MLAQYSIVMEKVDAIAKAQTESTGVGMGKQASWAIAVVIITVIIGLVGLYLAIR